MICPITTIKFVGTVSLGLFTGISYSLSALSLPALLSLPSAPQAQHAYTALIRSSTLHLRVLAGISIVTFPLVFAVSSPRRKHPYLLWTALTAMLGLSTDLLIGGTTFEEAQEANGETVERAVQTAQRAEAVKGALGFAAFSMAVVGLWGDGA